MDDRMVEQPDRPNTQANMCGIGIPHSCENISNSAVCPIKKCMLLNPSLSGLGALEFLVGGGVWCFILLGSPLCLKTVGGLQKKTSHFVKRIGKRM
jgi:hypothetical protein